MSETLEILQPTLRIEENSPTFGRISLEPLERGYGMTLGNALRRVLLSSIQGAAITAVRIDGVLHEFSTVKGVQEDVIEILMNLKNVPVRSRSQDVRVVSLDVEKAGVVTAGDINEDGEVEFIDPDAVICTLEEGAHLSMELYIEQGAGYLSAERPRPSFLPVDALLTDAIFTPVHRVNYHVDAARVGQRTDYERLTLEVWTNGVVAPDEAVGEAAQILESYFTHIAASIDQSEGVAPVEGTVDSSGPVSEAEHVPLSTGTEEMLARPIRELELSIRSENCLLRGNIQTIGDLLQKSRDDLLKIRNLGKISLTEIEEKLASSGLSLSAKKAGSAGDKSKAKKKQDNEAPDGSEEGLEDAEETASEVSEPDDAGVQEPELDEAKEAHELNEADEAEANKED